MTETGAPPPSSSNNSAERAKLIMERSRSDMSRETRDIGRNTKDQKQQRPIQITSEQLPPKTENRATPQKLEGQVIEVKADTARIQTAEGEIKIRIPEGVKLTAGQKVTIDIPPDTRSGDQITLRIEAPRDIEAPLPPPRPDFPPLRAGDTVIATHVPVAEPLSQKQSNPAAESYSTAPRQSPPTALAARLTDLNFPTAEKLSLPINDSLVRFALMPEDPVQNWLKSDIQTVLPTSQPVSQQAPLLTPPDDDNVLTQAARPSHTGPVLPQNPAFPASLTLTDSAFSTLSENAPNLFPGATALQNLFKAIPAAQPAGNITDFLQIQVLGLIPPNTPPAEAQKLMDQLLSPTPAERVVSEKNDIIPASPTAAPITGSASASAPINTDTAPQTPAAAAPVMATVIGTGNTGQTLITVPAPMADSGQNLLHIQTLVTIAPGTQMAVTVTPLTAEGLQNTPDLINKLPPDIANQITKAQTPSPAFALPPPIGLPALAPTWPALQESLTLLQQTAPQAAQAVQNSLPTPSPRMVSTALFFLAALKLGGIDNWLGDKNIDSLKKAGKSGLASRLAGDFKSIAAQANESLPGQWKAITLPLLHEGQISNLQFFVRSEDSQQENTPSDDDSGKTRFVLNLELSKIGPLQLDGYLAPENLDLIIRTDHRMDSAIRQDIMRIFSDALELINLKGGLLFQNQPENWVHILASDTKDGFFI